MTKTEQLVEELIPILVELRRQPSRYRSKEQKRQEAIKILRVCKDAGMVFADEQSRQQAILIILKGSPITPHPRDRMDSIKAGKIFDELFQIGLRKVEEIEI